MRETRSFGSLLLPSPRSATPMLGHIIPFLVSFVFSISVYVRYTQGGERVFASRSPVAREVVVAVKNTLSTFSVHARGEKEYARSLRSVHYTRAPWRCSYSPWTRLYAVVITLYFFTCDRDFLFFW